MAEATITWLENMTFVGTDSTNHSVVLSSPSDGVGMKPSELLLVAVGSCTAVDVVNILRKKRRAVSGLRIKVTAEQAADPPWSFQKMHIHYELTGPNLREADVAKAIELSEHNYCSVSTTLAPTVAITTSYEIHPPEE
jgi:putative redox protein